MMTHENALKAYHFDALALMGSRDKCTVQALRAAATHVDTTERPLDGLALTAGTGSHGRVTTGDVNRLFKRFDEDTKAGKAKTGQVAEEA